MPDNYDALLLVSFGGPENREDVIPFLENVLRGKPVPRERMLEVAEHYYHFDGVSPINHQNRLLIDALRTELDGQQIPIPIYWGNRNWHPLLPAAVQQMKDDGVQRALAIVTSVFSSYSGCRQYRENIQHSLEHVGEGAPQIDKLRSFFNHPGFIETMAERVRDTLEQIPADRRDTTHLAFTAHSIPEAMACGCQYTNQLAESCRLVTAATNVDSWKLVYQSRSGSPSQPWLEPDICDYLQEIHDSGQIQDVVVVPIGFISDHMEVLFDLDTEARELCDRIGLNMVRAKTAGTHPRFVSMLRELIVERTTGTEKQSVGQLGASHDICPIDCCPSGRSARRE
jgi:ferrochelatase